MFLSLIRKETICFYLCKCPELYTFQPDDLHKTVLAVGKWDCTERHQHWWIISPKCCLPCAHTTAASGAPTSPTLLGIISYLTVKQSQKSLDSTVCMRSLQVPCLSPFLPFEMIRRLVIEMNLCRGHLIIRSFVGQISNVHLCLWPRNCSYISSTPRGTTLAHYHARHHKHWLSVNNHHLRFNGVEWRLQPFMWRLETDIRGTNAAVLLMVSWGLQCSSLASASCQLRPRVLYGFPSICLSSPSSLTPHLRNLFLDGP